MAAVQQPQQPHPSRCETLREYFSRFANFLKTEACPQTVTHETVDRLLALDPFGLGYELSTNLLPHQNAFYPETAPLDVEFLLKFLDECNPQYRLVYTTQLNDDQKNKIRRYMCCFVDVITGQ